MLPGCSLRHTTSHILNGCKICLPRYEWRHDGINSYIFSCIDKSKFECFADLEGHQTPGGGTILPQYTITTLRPDIIVTDKNTKKMFLLELTVPIEQNEVSRHQDKLNKYNHFLTEITDVEPTLICYEIGSRGYISKSNIDRLKLIHKFCKPGIKFKTFMENVSCLAVSASYYIFINRKIFEWENPPYLKPPF